MTTRSSGILLHITSLPGPEGIGTLGGNAFRFVDFLERSRQKVWQILPVGPVGYGNSPYQCYSAFAGHHLMIDLVELVNDGLLLDNDLKKIPRFDTKQVEFDKVAAWKMPLLQKAYQNFGILKVFGLKDDYGRFLDENGWWLSDFTLFFAAKGKFKGDVWNNWEKGLKFRDNETLEQYREELAEEAGFWEFVQFCFFRQWFKLKEYANSKGVKIIGDIPLYVALESVDVWANPDIFLLDEDLKPTHVGGVPPDYYSETGQLWGTPVFNWQGLKKREFDWWLARIHFNLDMFDLLRIDHFRGLESFWSVKVGEKNAVNGEWAPAYGNELLTKLKGQISDLPIIAEDLGVITPEVERLRDDFNLPGMKVLQFAFTSDEKNEYLPHNYTSNYVVYTGTHDNDTSLAWFKSRNKTERRMIGRYLSTKKNKIVKQLIEAAWASVAGMAIFPLQDLFELGSEARMNIPGVATGNWGWRFRWKQVKGKHIRFLKDLTKQYNR